MTRYQTGFANQFESEALPGALPQGRNSPQRPAFGLYAEQISGTAFTVPRADNRRSWLYRMRPSAAHAAFTLMLDMREKTDAPPSPNRMRWAPMAMPDQPIDLLESIRPMLFNGDPHALTGAAFNTYACNRSMGARAFFNADAETVLVPEQGGLTLFTEMGRIDVEPLEIAVIPRGVKHRIELTGETARGFLVENFGAHFRLPELGPLGANGLANPRDFQTPVAWFEDRDEPFELIQKYGGAIWRTMLDHSPLDVVAWHGNCAPYKYDLRRFNTMGTISYDHPDPSIFTVLTSPSDTSGRANADFVIFPPRWMVGEDTFRPPWFHRNIMSEAMGVISGVYDAKADIAPGCISLHNCMAAHGPDVPSWRKASEAELAPHKINNTMAFMVETGLPWRVTARMMAEAEPDYDRVWDGFPKAVITG